MPQFLGSIVKSEQLTVLQMDFGVAQIGVKKLTKLANCADAFSSQNRAYGVRFFFIGNQFAVLVHRPSSVADSVYDIAKVGEDARVKLFRQQEQFL